MQLLKERILGTLSQGQLSVRDSLLQIETLEDKRLTPKKAVALCNALQAVVPRNMSPGDPAKPHPGMGTMHSLTTRQIRQIRDHVGTSFSTAQAAHGSNRPTAMIEHLENVLFIMIPGHKNWLTSSLADYDNVALRTQIVTVALDKFYRLLAYMAVVHPDDSTYTKDVNRELQELVLLTANTSASQNCEWGENYATFLCTRMDIAMNMELAQMCAIPGAFSDHQKMRILALLGGDKGVKIIREHLNIPPPDTLVLEGAIRDNANEIQSLLTQISASTHTKASPTTRSPTMARGKGKAKAKGRAKAKEKAKARVARTASPTSETTRTGTTQPTTERNELEYGTVQVSSNPFNKQGVKVYFDVKQQPNGTIWACATYTIRYTDGNGQYINASYITFTQGRDNVLIGNVLEGQRHHARHWFTTYHLVFTTNFPFVDQAAAIAFDGTLEWPFSLLRGLSPVSAGPGNLGRSTRTVALLAFHSQRISTTPTFPGSATSNRHGHGHSRTWLCHNAIPPGMAETLQELNSDPLCITGWRWWEISTESTSNHQTTGGGSSQAQGVGQGSADMEDDEKGSQQRVHGARTKPGKASRSAMEWNNCQRDLRQDLPDRKEGPKRRSPSPPGLQGEWLERLPSEAHPQDDGHSRRKGQNQARRLPGNVGLLKLVPPSNESHGSTQRNTSSSAQHGHRSSTPPPVRKLGARGELVSDTIGHHERDTDEVARASHRPPTGVKGRRQPTSSGNKGRVRSPSLCGTMDAISPGVCLQGNEMPIQFLTQSRISRIRDMQCGDGSINASEQTHQDRGVNVSNETEAVKQSRMDHTDGSGQSIGNTGLNEGRCRRSDSQHIFTQPTAELLEAPQALYMDTAVRSKQNTIGDQAVCDNGVGNMAHSATTSASASSRVSVTNSVPGLVPPPPALMPPIMPHNERGCPPPRFPADEAEENFIYYCYEKWDEQQAYNRKYSPAERREIQQYSKELRDFNRFSEAERLQSDEAIVKNDLRERMRNTVITKSGRHTYCPNNSLRELAQSMADKGNELPMEWIRIFSAGLGQHSADRRLRPLVGNDDESLNDASGTVCNESMDCEGSQNSHHSERNDGYSHGRNRSDDDQATDQYHADHGNGQHVQQKVQQRRRPTGPPQQGSARDDSAGQSSKRKGISAIQARDRHGGGRAIQAGPKLSRVGDKPSSDQDSGALLRANQSGHVRPTMEQHEEEVCDVDGIGHESPGIRRYGTGLGTYGANVRSSLHVSTTLRQTDVAHLPENTTGQRPKGSLGHASTSEPSHAYGYVDGNKHASIFQVGQKAAAAAQGIYHQRGGYISGLIDKGQIVVQVARECDIDWRHDVGQCQNSLGLSSWSSAQNGNRYTKTHGQHLNSAYRTVVREARKRQNRNPVLLSGNIIINLLMGLFHSSNPVRIGRNKVPGLTERQATTYLSHMKIIMTSFTIDFHYNNVLVKELIYMARSLKEIKTRFVATLDLGTLGPTPFASVTATDRKDVKANITGKSVFQQIIAFGNNQTMDLRLLRSKVYILWKIQSCGRGTSMEFDPRRQIRLLKKRLTSGAPDVHDPNRELWDRTDGSVPHPRWCSPHPDWVHNDEHMFGSSVDDEDGEVGLHQPLSDGTDPQWQYAGYDAHADSSMAFDELTTARQWHPPMTTPTPVSEHGEVEFYEVTTWAEADAVEMRIFDDKGKSRTIMVHRIRRNILRNDRSDHLGEVGVVRLDLFIAMDAYTRRTQDYRSHFPPSNMVVGSAKEIFSYWVDLVEFAKFEKDLPCEYKTCAIPTLTKQVQQIFRRSGWAVNTNEKDTSRDFGGDLYGITSIAGHITRSFACSMIDHFGMRCETFDSDEAQLRAGHLKETFERSYSREIPPAVNLRWLAHPNKHRLSADEILFI